MRAAPSSAPIHETFTISETPPPPPALAAAEDMTPSSLADAVMRELSDGTPETKTRSSRPPPIVEPGELRPRASSNPPSVREVVVAPSLPPDAVVPEADASADSPEIQPRNASDDAPAIDDESSDVMADAMTDAGAVVPEPTDIDAPVDRFEASAPLLRSIPIEIDMRSRTPAPVAAPPVATSPIAAPSGFGSAASDEELVVDGEPRPIPTPLTHVALSDVPGLPKRGGRWGFVLGMGVLAALTAVALLMTRNPAPYAAASAEGPAQPTTGVPLSSESGGLVYGDVPAGLDVPAGQGLLEMTIASGNAVRVDGAPRGGGPKLRVPLSAGPHEIRVEGGDHDGHAGAPRVRTIEVRAGLAARVDLTRAP